MENDPSIAVNPEFQAVQQELSFLNVESLDSIRKEHEREESAAAHAVMANASLEDVLTDPMAVRDARNAARQGVRDSLDQQYSDYLAQHVDRDANPARFDAMLNLLLASSIARQKSTEWYLGNKDQNGQYDDIETSGRYRAQAAFDELCKEIYDERHPEEEEATTEVPYTPEDLRLANDKLNQKRQKLAELSVQRRALIRKNSKKAKRLATEYDAAKAEYDEAYKVLSFLSLENLKAEGHDEETIKTAFIMGTVEELHNVTKAEYETYQNDDSRRGRLVRRIAASRFGFFAASAAVGAGAGFAARKIATGVALLTPVGMAAAGAAVAVRTTSAVVRATLGNRVNLQKTHDKRGQADAARVEAHARDMDVDWTQGSDEIVRGTSSLVSEAVDVSIEKDRKRNRNRVYAAAAISGAAAVGGALLADHFMQPSKPNVTIIDIQPKQPDLAWLKTQAAHDYFEWAKQFKVANPNLSLASGGNVNLATDPYAYDGRMFELWNQYFDAAKAAKAAKIGLKVINQ